MFSSIFQFVKLWEETLSLVMNRVKCTAPWACMTVSCGNDSDGTEERLPFEPEGAERKGGERRWSGTHGVGWRGAGKKGQKVRG